MFCTTDKALPGAAPIFPGGLVWREVLEALSIGIESAAAFLATLSLDGVNRRRRSVLCHIWCCLSRQGRLRCRCSIFAVRLGAWDW